MSGPEISSKAMLAISRSGKDERSWVAARTAAKAPCRGKKQVGWANIHEKLLHLTRLAAACPRPDAGQIRRAHLVLADQGHQQRGDLDSQYAGKGNVWRREHGVRRRAELAGSIKLLRCTLLRTGGWSVGSVKAQTPTHTQTHRRTDTHTHTRHAHKRTHRRTQNTRTQKHRCHDCQSMNRTHSRLWGWGARFE